MHCWEMGGCWQEVQEVQSWCCARGHLSHRELEVLYGCPIAGGCGQPWCRGVGVRALQGLQEPFW